MLRSKGVDIGDRPQDIEASEHAFTSTLGGKAALDDAGVRSLLGVSGDTQVRARVIAKPPNGVEIQSSLKDAKGNHLALLNRSYTRDANGLTVHHDYLVLDDAQKGKGLGGSLIRNQLEQYEKLGVSKIEMTAAWDGRYVWPKMGFEVEDHEKPLLKRRWASFQKRKGLPPTAINGVQDIVNHPEGKAFLLGKRAPMLQLTATPAQLKAKLNAKRKA